MKHICIVFTECCFIIYGGNIMVVASLKYSVVSLVINKIINNSVQQIVVLIGESNFVLNCAFHFLCCGCEFCILILSDNPIVRSLVPLCPVNVLAVGCL